MIADSDRLAIARLHLELGIGTLPARHRGKAVALSSWTEYTTRLPTDDELESWFGNGAIKNLWVVCGQVSRLLILDLDNKAAFHWWRTHLSSHGIDLNAMGHVKTSRGRHYWFRTPAEVEVPHWTSKPNDPRQFEVRGDGLGTICPPSIHESGHVYTWIEGDRVALLHLPWLTIDQLAAFVKPPPEPPPSSPPPPHRMIKREADKLAVLTEDRNIALNSAALQLGHYAPHIITEQDITDALVEASQSNGLVHDDGMNKVLATIRSGLTRGMAEPRQAPQPVDKHLTDLGNGRRLVARHGKDLKYIPSWKRWLIWSNRGWQSDETLEVARRAKDTAISIYQEASDPEIDPDRRKAISGWAGQSESEFRIRAMMAMAQSESEITITPDQLDRDPWLFSTQLGVIERDGSLRPHQREDLLTKLSPVVYDANAAWPLWAEFLDHAMNGDQDMIAFLQRAVGYSMTGITTEKCLFVIHGPTDTGKTVFVETVRALMGDYAHTMKDTTLLVSKWYGANNDDIADLRGTRFATLSETPDGARLNAALVKQLTGGGAIRAMRKYEHPFEFTPTTKFWIDTNHRPHINADDDAMWGRVRSVPFSNIVPKARQDRQLMTKLRGELPGILNWALAGRRAWQQIGLSPPPPVAADTARYRASEDTFSQFLANECQPSADHIEGSSTLLTAYKAYSGDQRMTPEAFKMRMELRGYEWVRTSRKRGFRGIEWIGTTM